MTKNLIEEYLLKNQILDIQPRLSRYLIDQYLSSSNIGNACKIFSKNEKPITDEYLSKFNIYCLVNDEKFEEAQLILDLKKELGFSDEYFENKMNICLVTQENIDLDISEKTILDFHLAHRTNPEFNFDPKDNTINLYGNIWRHPIYYIKLMK